MAEAAFLGRYREYLDYWLLQRFPGRTLEELDDVDWLRLQRAMDVQRIVDVEARRKAFHAGHTKALEPHEWRAIREHDRLLAELDD